MKQLVLIAIMAVAVLASSGSSMAQNTAPACHSAQSNQAHMGVYLAQAENGVLIEDVASDAPAQKAGLAGGDVITQINDVAVSSPDALKEQLATLKPGDKATISYLRNGQAANATVLLGAKPAQQNNMHMMQQHVEKTTCNANANRGFMGVVLNVNKQETQENGKVFQKTTITIEEVVKGSPAEKAGLQANDIITAVNGTLVSADADVLSKVLEKSKPGDVVRLGYTRNGAAATASITLDKAPETSTTAKSGASCGSNAEKADSKKAFLGVIGETLTPAMAQANNAKKAKGVLISEVTKGSAAEKAGLQAGDIITYLNKEDMETMEELQNTLASMIVGDKVTIKYLRNGKNKKAATTLLAKSSADAGCCSKNQKSSCGEKKGKE
ncbi:MAG TPA: PDZ domain-containing protein [Chitinophagales bacterium]|nr:PDZ domain-containing protein [Chitinophagales bacterium]HRK26022.1 PDZ domain-containing protein [Chitinophagales bacterium]